MSYFYLATALVLLFTATAAYVAQPSTQQDCKRGTGYDFQNVTDLAALRHLAWFYTWGVQAPDKASDYATEHNIEFVPMQWSQWGLEHLSQDLPREARTLLGPNEPNHHLQANLTPEDAAKLWPSLQKVADERGLRLGSPAASPCGANCVLADPFEWLDRFLAACNGCRIDFIASHYYSCSPRYLALYLAALAQYGRPIWLTEFACPLGPSAGNEPAQEAYMAAALNVLDRDRSVERYAWFAPRTGDFDWIGPSASLLQPGTSQLTRLGTLYTRAPYPYSNPNTFATAPSPAADAGTASLLGDPYASSSYPAQSVSTLAEALAPAASPRAGPEWGGSWRSLCRECTDEGTGLSAISAGDRGARVQHCQRECGYWSYGTELLSPNAGDWSRRCFGCDDQGAALRRMFNGHARQQWTAHCRDCGYAKYGLGILQGNATGAGNTP